MQRQLSPTLPISKYQDKIADLIKNQQVVVISGKTGCGKSTQVPQYILRNNPSAKIAICQPRRVAATSLAVRVSEEMGCKLGTKVGYHIGLQTFRGQKSNIIYMTYGILIQQLLFMKELPYSHIILDQIHERSLQMDFTFVALKNILNSNNKTKAKIIIMSATLNAEEFAEYFSIHSETKAFLIPNLRIKSKNQNNTDNKRGRGRGRRQEEENENIQDKYQRVKPEGKYIPAATFTLNDERQFKVDQYFLDDFKKQDYLGNSLDDIRLPDSIVDFACSLLSTIQQKYKNGDVLIFLPGIFQIRLLKTKLMSSYEISQKRIVQVHSMFSQELYDNLFKSKVKNKIILATNIGQSSITLPDCKAVIDFCLTRKNITKNKTVTRLQTRMASKASLTQRMGRVGRVSDGVVYRMITRTMYQTLTEFEVPQIHLVSLQMVILRTKQLDLSNNSDIAGNPYLFLINVIDPPNLDDIRQALKYLVEEQAIVAEEGGGFQVQTADKLFLTAIGEFMVSMPCDLQISKMILMGLKLNIPKIMITIGSILMSPKPLFSHQQKRDSIEDFLHNLIGYDKGFFNDYLLRENLFDHWKNNFYYPVKEKKLYKRKYQKAQMEEEKSTTKTNSNQRVFENQDIEQEEIFKFLQDFNQEKWSQKERDWCMLRSVYPNVMRDIVKIEESIKMKIQSMGYVFKQNERFSNQLVLLCIAYGFPDNSCNLVWNTQQLTKGENPYFAEFKNVTSTHDDYIVDYCYPQTDFKIQIANDKNSKKVFGSSSVLKKFLLPQFYQKSKLDKCSQIYFYLTKNKPVHKFNAQILYKRRPIIVLNQSINKVNIPPKLNRHYCLLTHKFQQMGDKKMLSTCALIQESQYHLIQLISIKNVQVSAHPSNQFFSHFTIDNHPYQFSTMMRNQDIDLINEMRKLANRQKSNRINCSDQIMKQKDIERLLELLRNSQSQIQKQSWEFDYILSKKMENNRLFCKIQHAPKLNGANTFYQNYKQWKKQKLYAFYNWYRPLIMDNYFIICKECLPNEITQIDTIKQYNREKDIFNLNQYAGSWETIKNSNILYCKNKHEVGIILDVQTMEEARLNKQKCCIYYPYNKVIDFFKEWPSSEELARQLQNGLIELNINKKKVNYFECMFCFDYNRNNDEPIRKIFDKQELNQSFWKKVMEHLRSHIHTQNVGKFKKSIK